MWKVGIAFVRGLNMYGANRISRESMLGLAKKIENENLEILGIYRADNIIFRKKEMHFAEVGRRLEKALGEHFQRKIYVTARSAESVRGALETCDALMR
jgi:uncharacterized protein (DUF1697 family)